MRFSFFSFFEDLLSKKHETRKDEIEQKGPEQAPKSPNKEQDIDSDEEKEIFEEQPCMMQRRHSLIWFLLFELFNLFVCFRGN